MTVASTYTPPQYSGNGTTTAFAFSYPFFNPADLTVTLFNTSTNTPVSPAPVLNGGATYDYTVTGTLDVNTGEYLGGATITFNTAPPGGYTVTIERTVAATQNVSLTQNAPFPSKTIEGALDRLTMLDQQEQALTARVLRIPATDPALNLTFPPAATRANQFAGFDGDGNATVFAALAPSTPVSTAMAPVLAASTLANAAAAMDVLPTSGGTVTGNLTITGGTLAGSEAGVFTDTQMNVGLSFLLNGASPATEYQAQQGGHNATYAVIGGAAIGGGASVHEAGGVFGLVTVGNSATEGAAGTFYAIVKAGGANAFGTNVLVDDTGHVSNLTGTRWTIKSEQVDSSAFGSTMIAAFAGGTPVVSYAHQIAATLSPWAIGWLSNDGAAVTGIQLNAVGNAANSDSQTIVLGARDNGNTIRQVTIKALHGTSGANLELTTPTGGVVMSALELVSGLASFAQGVVIQDSSGTLALFQSGVTTVGSVSTNGTTTAYNTTSDARLKTLHGAADGSVIDGLKVHVGAFNASPDVKRSMLVAHEAQEVAPWAVTGTKDQVHECDVVNLREEIVHRAGDIKPQMVDHSAFVPDLIAKCQTLQAQIRELTADLATIKAAMTPKAAI